MRSFVAALLLATETLVSSSVLAAQENSTGVGFKSVQEALDTLKATAGVEITTTQPDGWTVANDSKNNTQWSFTPLGHYAHPAVVKRAIKQSPIGQIYIEMSGLCQAEKEPCDKLMSEFEQLNERMRQNIQRRLQQK